MEQDGNMRWCSAELARHVFARDLVYQPQVDDGTLHLVQGHHAAESQRMLLCACNDLVGGLGV